MKVLLWLDQVIMLNAMCTDYQPIDIYRLGRMPYKEALDLQTELFEKLKAAKTGKTTPANDSLLIVEHDPVYTLGKHANEANMLTSESILRSKGIECYRITRGGDITYHGPGQLVAYPIIDLERYRLGIKKYIDLLEESVIRTIDSYGIKGERVKGATGVWIGTGTPEERKICAIGVKSSRYVTMHGLALNVNTDLSYFSAINPCGFIDKGVTSIAKELNRTIDFEEVQTVFIKNFLDLLLSRI